ncbi:MAG: hypothetical protein K2H64_12670 [Desulfovibrio sp.]|nr:hypothetical protein [Desulfovibrio sp.]
MNDIFARPAYKKFMDKAALNFKAKPVAIKLSGVSGRSFLIERKNIVPKIKNGAPRGAPLVLKMSAKGY